MYDVLARHSYVEEGEGERVGEVQSTLLHLVQRSPKCAMKSYGFGFLPSLGALAEAATGLGFQKSGSALIHSSCT
jgi:hypothetical protein